MAQPLNNTQAHREEILSPQVSYSGHITLSLSKILKSGLCRKTAVGNLAAAAVPETLYLAQVMAVGLQGRSSARTQFWILYMPTRYDRPMHWPFNGMAPANRDNLINRIANMEPEWRKPANNEQRAYLARIPCEWRGLSAFLTANPAPNRLESCGETISSSTAVVRFDLSAKPELESFGPGAVAYRTADTFGRVGQSN